VIHRDVGYVCVGLTLVYAVSGVAVNHVRDWNPNYRITRDTVSVSDVSRESTASPDFAKRIVAGLGLGTEVRGTFRVDSATLDVFLEDASVRVDLDQSTATVERVRERRILRAMNVLHLNEPRGLWTLTADLFAVALILLAATGLFMMKGKYGITGRGAWLTGAGIVIPLLFLFLLA
jgi:hypothetical protein